MNEAAFSVKPCENPRASQLKAVAPCPRGPYAAASLLGNERAPERGRLQGEFYGQGLDPARSF